MDRRSLQVLTVIAILINMGDYFFIRDLFVSSIPPLYYNICDCGDLYHGDSNTPYIAPGPSKVQEFVPISVLKENVKIDSLIGLKYLDHISLSRYYQCQPSKKFSVQSDSKWCSKRSFQSQNSPLVALASFHGSGNTWLRYLIEQATGHYTGSIYCDETLKSVFPGEFVVSGNVITIKTHHADTTALPKDIQLATGRKHYHKAIVLVRNPFDALISEANRRWNSKRSLNNHVGLADETSFISNSKWDWFVEYKGISWAYFLHTWLVQNDTDIHVVQYERLIEHPKLELRRLLNFLNVSISSEKIKCAISNSNDLFKRIDHLNFNPYSKDNREALNRHMEVALPLLAKFNITYTLR